MPVTQFLVHFYIARGNCIMIQDNKNENKQKNQHKLLLLEEYLYQKIKTLTYGVPSNLTVLLFILHLPYHSCYYYIFTETRLCQNPRLHETWTALLTIAGKYSDQLWRCNTAVGTGDWTRLTMGNSVKKILRCSEKKKKSSAKACWSKPTPAFP